MPARVRYLKGPEVIRIEGVGDVSRIDREVFFGPSDTLESASLSDLRREARKVLGKRGLGLRAGRGSRSRFRRPHRLVPRAQGGV